MFKRLIFALLGSSVLLAAPAAAQTYVRPSKGTGFVAVTNSAVPLGDSAVTSAVYDMSSFSEVVPQIQLVQESPLAVRATYVRSWSVSKFGRYIRFVTSVVGNGSPPVIPGYPPEAFPVYVKTQTSENPAGPFVDYAGGGSVEVVTGSPNPIWIIKGYTVAVTPIPFQSVQYMRFQKGEPTVLLNRVINGDGSLSFYTPPLDMTSYAGMAIRISNDNNNCNPGLGVQLFEGDTLDGLNTVLPGPTYRTPAVRNKYVIVNGSYAYTVPVTSKYVRLYLFETTTLVSPNVCATPFVVTVTPLPYEPTAEYGSPYADTSIISLTGGVPGTAQSTTSSRFPTLRLQNLGAGPAECSTSSTAIRWPIKLAPDTGLTGAGGSVELKGYAGPVWCRKTTATDTSIGAFNY